MAIELKKTSRKLDMKYALFESVEQMLTPESLSDLSGKAIRHVRYRTMEHNGASGSQLMTVEADSNPRSYRYVLKRISKSMDWLMVASEDHKCRSVTLWQSGMLDQLGPEIDHAILACARDGDGWALLMRDISDTLILGSYPYTSAQVYAFSEALSALHAKFWEHPALEDPDLGLCDISGMLRTLSPENARRYQEGSGSPGWTDWVIDNNALLLEMVAQDVADALGELQDNLQPLLKALGSGPRTLLHGDFQDRNLGLIHNGQSRVVLFDWGLAGYGLPTVDLGWFLDKVVYRSEVPPDAAISHYRRCLERRLGVAFQDEAWQRWQTLGRLAHILRLGFVIAWLTTQAKTEDERTNWKRIVDGYNDPVRAGLKWL